MIDIAILGYGTVGSGIVEVINSNKDIITVKAGNEINIKYVFDIRDFPGNPIQEKITHDFEDILNDDSVKVVAEVMGGVEPAYTFTTKLLKAGKSVVTSNKELVALHGATLIKLARENKTNYTFEASVGGGIPIIRPLNTSFSSDEIVEISGILNGTTNFILTKMSDEGRSFDSVLEEAQALGYAERNPEADVKGYDACRKIAILASLALCKTVDYNDIYTEGIEKITPRDLEYVKGMNACLKLVATCKVLKEGIFARVVPLIIPLTHPLSMVNDVYNAVFVHGNAVGNTMFYGRGAGKLPTASACVADIIDSARHIGINVRFDWSEEKIDLMDIKDVPVKALIRILSVDQDAAKKAAAEFFPDSMIITMDESETEFAVITGTETEGSLREKCRLLSGNKSVKSIGNMLRMEEQ